MSDTGKIVNAYTVNYMHMHSCVRRGVHRCTHQFGLFLVLYCSTPGPCYFNSKIKAVVLIGGAKR